MRIHEYKIMDNNMKQHIYKLSMIIILFITACGSSNNNQDIDFSDVTNSKLLKTGQVISYEKFDDGYYEKGLTPKYTRESQGVIKNNLNSLIWQDNKEPTTLTITWTSAKEYCSNLILASFSDWRLPTRAELESIVDYGRYDPSMNETFKNIETYNNWTSSSLASDNSQAWVFSFLSGEQSYTYKSNYGNVRCVSENIIFNNIGI